MRGQRKAERNAERNVSMVRVAKTVRRMLPSETYADFIRRIPPNVISDIMYSDKPEHKLGEYILGPYIEEYKRKDVNKKKVILIALNERMKQLGFESHVSFVVDVSERRPRKDSILYKMQDMLGRIKDMRVSGDIQNVAQNLDYLEKILLEQKRRLEKIRNYASSRANTK